jgi:CheY-like chemotaxis protein
MLKTTVDSIPRRGRARPSVIVADASASFRGSVSGLLGPRFRVHHAEDGLAVVHLLRIVQPKIIVCDIHLPVLDGIELVARLRTHHEYAKLARTPFVLVGEGATVEEISCGISLGAQRYLEKPTLPSAFLDAVVRLIEGVNTIPQAARL